MINITSNNLLSYDFLHDNSGQLTFFKEYDVYNLNNLNSDLPNNEYINNLNNNVKFRINENIIKGKISENIEQYVKDIMLSEFTNNKNNYININKNAKFEYEKNYVLIFDNMQCNIKNIINIKTLMNKPNIVIYIPFILCCETIKQRCKEGNENNENKCTNIKGAFNSIVENIKLHNTDVKIMDCDFYEKDNKTLKKKYIMESMLIGFDYINNKLLNFNDIKNLSGTEKTIKLINKFINFTEIIKINDRLFYDNVIVNILKDIEDLKNSKFIDDAKNINKKKFNNIKSLIYSMKEMRDWYYVKEIINKNVEFTKIYCTSDSINLFRSVLYGISTINLHNNHIKYIALQFEDVNDKKYLFYKQISPSYFYTFDAVKEDLIKQKMFKLINDENTFIVKKQIIGGNNIYKNNLLISNNNKKNDFLILNNIKINKYNIKYNMDIIDFKLKFTSLLMSLYSNVGNIFRFGDDILINHDNINNIENKNLSYIKNLYIDIQHVYDITNEYQHEDLKKINYMNITDKEYEYIKNKLDNNTDEYIKNKLDNDIDDYKCMTYLFYHNCLKYYNEKYETLKNNKFYSNPNYTLTENEIKSSIIFNYIINKIFEIDEREKFGYLIKIILNEYDYNLFRNALAIFYDVDDCYNEYIRGKFKFADTFDEEDYEYKTKIVTDYFYNPNNDKLPTEYFEDDYKLYNSKYDELQQIIKDKNI